MVTQGRVSHTHMGPAVTAIQTIAEFLAPLGSFSLITGLVSVPGCCPRDVGVRDGSLWSPLVPRTHAGPGSQEVAAL